MLIALWVAIFLCFAPVVLLAALRLFADAMHGPREYH